MDENCSNISQFSYFLTHPNPTVLLSRDYVTHEMLDNEFLISGRKFIPDLNSDVLLPETELLEQKTSADPALKRSQPVCDGK